MKNDADTHDVVVGRDDDETENIVRLDQDECWRIVDRHQLGRLGVVERGRPAVLPVNFARDGSSLIVRVRPGSTIASAADGRRAVLEVDEVDEDLERGRSVVVHGLLREVIHDDERARLSRLVIRPWAGGSRQVYVRLDAEEITGRSVPLSAASDGLAADGG